MRIEFLAALVTVFATLVAVVYASGDFDAWDATIALFVLYVCYSHRTELAAERRSLWIARAGVSISFMIVCMTILTSWSPDLARRFVEKWWRLFSGHFALSAAIFVVTPLLFPGTRNAAGSVRSAGVTEQSGRLGGIGRRVLAMLGHADGLRTFIQVFALIATLESAVFLAKGSFLLSAPAIAALGQTYVGFNLPLVQSLSQQTADYRVGSILLLLAFVLQMANVLWPMRWKDFTVSPKGACLALIVGAMLLGASWWLADRHAARIEGEVRQMNQQTQRTAPARR